MFACYYNQIISDPLFVVYCIISWGPSVYTTMIMLRTLPVLLLIHLCCCFSQMHCLQRFDANYGYFCHNSYRAVGVWMCCVGVTLWWDREVIDVTWIKFNAWSVCIAQYKLKEDGWPFNVGELSHCCYLSVFINAAFCRFRSVYV